MKPFQPEFRNIAVKKTLVVGQADLDAKPLPQMVIRRQIMLQADQVHVIAKAPADGIEPVQPGKAQVIGRQDGLGGEIVERGHDDPSSGNASTILRRAMGRL